MPRTVRALMIGAAAAALLALSPGPGTAGSGLRAVMDGRPITLGQAARLSCHDFDYPVLTCFATPEELEEAAAERARSGRAGADGTAALLTTYDYVVVFEHAGYGGAAEAITRDYSYLGDIGWNDKISSFKSYGATGDFWEHSPTGGFIYFFYPTSSVAYVGDRYNDKFSAVYLS